MCNDIIIEVFSEYSWWIATIHFALAVLLFFIINWIGAHSISVGYMQMDIVIKEESAPAFNFLFKVIAPIVFLVLSAVLFQSLNIPQLNKNCYFIVIFYWCFRLLWVLCTNRGSLTNWCEQILYWISSIGLSLWVYSLLESVEQILPTPRSLLDQLWILIIIFVYSTLNKIQISREGTIKRKNKYITSRYKKFRAEYNDIIAGYYNNSTYEAITYSIMIYEDFNRPKLIRLIEYLRFFITRKPHTLGIMQVTTDKWINNKKSIYLAMERIKHSGEEYIEKYKDYEYRNYYESPGSMAEYIANNYNSGDYTYASQIREVLDYINSTFYEGKLPSLFPPTKDTHANE